MKKILVANILPEDCIPLEATLADLGYAVETFDNTARHWVERYLLKPANKVSVYFRKALKIEKTPEIGSRSRFAAANYRSGRLLERAAAFRPDIVLVIRGHEVAEETIRKLKNELGVKKVACWWTKGSKWYELPQKEAPWYDAYFLINKDYRERLSHEGLGNCHHLPHAVNRAKFRKLPVTREDIGKYSCDVGFVGTCAKIRLDVVRQIKEKCRIKIYGSKWLRQAPRHPWLFRIVEGSYLGGGDLVKFYQIAKINLNVSVWFGGGTTGLNLRLFDVPASGGFLLTDYMEDIEDYYVIGEEIEIYRDAEELADKLDFYLKNESARQKIALKGHEKSLKLDDWNRRISQMTALIERA